MTDKDKKTVSVANEARPVRYISPFDEMEQMMEQFFDRDDWFSPLRLRPRWAELKPPFAGRTPRVDVIDRDKEVVVRAELPGVSKDDIDVSVAEDTLTIKASTRHEKTKEEGDYHRRELSSGEFTRRLQLPASVNASATVATFKDGLLELTLPKSGKVKRHNIKIK